MARTRNTFSEPPADLLSADREGMRPLRISGALKIAKGLTSLDEVLRIAPPAQDEKMG